MQIRGRESTSYDELNGQLLSLCNQERSHRTSDERKELSNKKKALLPRARTAWAVEELERCLHSLEDIIEKYPEDQ